MRNRAFTLIELMIAAAILVGAFLGILGVFTGCFNLNELTRNLTISLNGAQAEMESIRNLSFDSISAGTFEIAGIADADSEGIVEVDDTDPALLKVTITVCWRQNSGRIIGEDSDLNGEFVLGTEDENENGKLDSPAQMVTLMTRR